MPENKRIIRAGSFPLYEIAQSGDKLFVTIRESNNPNREIELLSSVVPMIIEALRQVSRES
jgi:hypothetical protein